MGEREEEVPKHAGRFIVWLGLGLGLFSVTVWWMKAESIPAYLALVPVLGAFLAGFLLIASTKNKFTRVWGGVVVLAAVLSPAKNLPQEFWWAVPLLILLSGIVFSRHAGSGLANLISFLFGMVGLGLLLSPVVSDQYLILPSITAVVFGLLGWVYSTNNSSSDTDRPLIVTVLSTTSLTFGLMFYALVVGLKHPNANPIAWITGNLVEVGLAILTPVYLGHLVYKYFFVNSFEESVEAASRFYWEVIDLFLPIKKEGEKN